MSEDIRTHLRHDVNVICNRVAARTLRRMVKPPSEASRERAILDLKAAFCIFSILTGSIYGGKRLFSLSLYFFDSSIFPARARTALSCLVESSRIW